MGRLKRLGQRTAWRLVAWLTRWAGLPPAAEILAIDDKWETFHRSHRADFERAARGSGYLDGGA